MLKKILFLLLLFCVSVSYSQKTVSDSLKDLLDASSTPREQVTSSIRLSNHFYNTQIYYDSAYYYNERAYEMALEHNLKDEEAIALFNFGHIYARLNDYDNAIDYYKRSYEMFTDSGATTKLSIVNSSIAALYFDKGDYQTAKSYFNKAIGFSESQNDLFSLAVDYINLGQTEYKLGNYLISKLHLEDGIQLLEDLNYPISASRIYYGNTLLALNRKREAKMQADIGYELAVEEENVEFIADASKLLYELSLDEGDYKKALTYYENYTLHKDSLYLARENNNIEKLRLNFNLNQKENDFEQLAQKKMYLYVIYALLGLGILLLIFFIINQRKITKMTADMHEVQIRLVDIELKKRNPPIPPKTEEI